MEMNEIDPEQICGKEDRNSKILGERFCLRSEEQLGTFELDVGVVPNCDRHSSRARNVCLGSQYC